VSLRSVKGRGWVSGFLSTRGTPSCPELDRMERLHGENGSRCGFRVVATERLNGVICGVNHPAWTRVLSAICSAYTTQICRVLAPGSKQHSQASVLVAGQQVRLL
jgi:hypothetical protein